MFQNSDDPPLHELLALLQSEVMAAPVLQAAEAEREAIETTKPVLASGRAEIFNAIGREAAILR
ncbi:hypothetical protein [Novosphingobium sp. BL-52-GroH]|uniref:hypothetical protein n=1 Tax=Novosphingobium sp. BL-52-GroH TaxID=3349877 RepID=UPI003850EDE6